MPTSFRLAAALLIASCLSYGSALTAKPLELRPGDTICLVGNTLAERMQHHNHWETLLYQRFPQHRLIVRNLSWPADEVALRPRADGFGTPEEQLTFSKADVILAFFGFNESFAGPNGVAAFKEQLGAWTAATLNANYSGKGAPRIALVSPIAHENLRNPHKPDGIANNRNLALYTAAVREVAEMHGVAFADVFAPTLALFGASSPHAPYTINGVHLHEQGDEAFGRILDRALFGQERSTVPYNEELRRAIADKNFHWYHRYRVVNSYYVYGGRSGLKFADGPQTNRDVLERERETLDVRSANRDVRIWQLVQDRGVAGPVDDSNVPAFLPVVTSFGQSVKVDPSGKRGDNSKSAEGSSAALLTAAETLSRFTLAPGYAINLFASEEQFPELANAVAITFDAKGRLWISTMPSYPQWRPGEAMNDKIVILTDTDGDGKADKSQVFADDLHLPISLEFDRDGVLVSQQRELIRLVDTDGDDRADQREIVLSGFDSADSHHALNTFTVDPGGALYFNEGTFHHSQIETPYGPVRCVNAGTYRFEPLTDKLDVFISYSYANPHGLAFDRWGQTFVSDSSPGSNYFGTAISGRLPYPEKHATLKQWFPKRVRPTSGGEFVASRHFPDEAQGNYLLNNAIGVQGVLQHTVRAVDSGYEGKEIEPIVLSDDTNFRPVDLEFGPDGALYLVDWQEALIGHMQYSIRDPLRDKLHARIWRVTYPSRPLVVPAKIAGESIEHLLALLTLPEDRTRIRAKQELARRNPQAVTTALATWMRSLDKTSPDLPHLLAEALWVHQWLDLPNVPLLKQQLRSPEPRARAAATRVLCYWRDRLPDALDLLGVQAKDEHPLVRLEAVRAASFFAGKKAVDVALEILNRPTDDYLTYTLEETMRALNPAPADVTDPRALAFVLGRTSNAELAKAPDSAAVFIAQIERQGFDPTIRERALSELARLRKTSREEEIAAALRRMDERFKDTGAADELGRLLAASPQSALQKIDPLVRRMAAKDHSLPQARRAGMAALVALEGSPSQLWAVTEPNTDARTMLLEAIDLIGDERSRSAFHPLIVDLFAKTPAELAPNVRAAALKALPSLGSVHAPATFALLARQLQAGKEVGIAARSLLQLPRESWDTAYAGGLTRSVLTYAETVPVHRRATPEFVDVVQLGTEAARFLPPEESKRNLRALRALGVTVFAIKAVREQMRYNVPQIVVEAGKPFELRFENTDIMPHNLVVVTPGSREEIGLAAAAMPMTPDKAGKLYVPVSDKVLASTKMLEPGQSETLRMRAPDTQGVYEYVCTFPGHWTIMWGKLIVTDDPDAVVVEPSTPTATAAPHTHNHPGNK